MTENQCEYIRFELVEKKPKTNVYDVINKNSGFKLGYIKWYPQWRQYCFFPVIYLLTVFSSGCLKDIKNFIDDLMEKRKEGKKKNDKML